ncbi:futalosine hydrolase [Geomonas oryzisoli]|uniref:Futalosine hydrolase n=1 Tax=Geomonas oryzisoli TaxID=2847992 RepID=A0ABX8JAD0_9BACT|nr:futalosine hydrolase [Geomonas oryzisoli]QWV94036.1 futalosine hydrolase [Geomonas oryzisoli]
MNRIIVTASTWMELSALVAATSAVALPGAGPLPVYRAGKGRTELLFVQTGIGKVNAAIAATLLCERYAPDLVVNTGCGGAFVGSGLAVGDLAVADSECLADEGVQTPAGWRGLDLIGIPVYEGRGERLFNRIPLDRDVARGALDLATAGGFKALMGPFLTVSTCSGTASQGEELLRRFPGVCENMEGAAVAQVAFSHGVPCLEIRGISNMVEDRDLSRWDLKGAVSEVQRFLTLYLEAIADIPRLA